MSGSIITSLVSLPQSPFPPLAVGFFGLGTGYLIYGTQELFGYPARNDSVDFATGMWGIWMPGFMQFITGIYLFAGLTLFGTFKTPSLYMAALAFTAYGVHLFASLKPDLPKLGGVAERVLGFFRLGTGFWRM